jgi:hypothetical protein
MEWLHHEPAAHQRSQHTSRPRDTEDGVGLKRHELIAQDRIAPSRVLLAAWELALLADPALTDDEVALATGRIVPVMAHARRLRGIVGAGRTWTPADI